MKPEEVKNFYRTNYNFHKKTGISSNSLANWLKKGKVPEGQQCIIERITNGQLKAELNIGALGSE